MTPLFIFILTLFINPALAKVPVAVTYFDNVGQNKELNPLQKGFAEMLITDLSVSDDIMLVERSQLNKIIDEIKLQDSPFINPKTAVMMGKGLGAEYVVTGSFLVQLDSIRVDARMIDVENAEVLIATSSEGKTSEFLTVQRQLARKLLEGMGIKLNMIQNKKIGGSSTSDFDAFSSYSKGLDLEDQGKSAEALQAYAEALKKDATFSLAEKNLSRIEERAAELIRKEELANANLDKIIEGMLLDYSKDDMGICPQLTQFIVQKLYSPLTTGIMAYRMPSLGKGAASPYGKVDPKDVEKKLYLFHVVANYLMNNSPNRGKKPLSIKPPKGADMAQMMALAQKNSCFQAEQLGLVYYLSILEMAGVSELVPVSGSPMMSLDDEKIDDGVDKMPKMRASNGEIVHRSDKYIAFYLKVSDHLMKHFPAQATSYAKRAQQLIEYTRDTKKGGTDNLRIKALKKWLKQDNGMSSLTDNIGSAIVFKGVQDSWLYFKTENRFGSGHVGWEKPWVWELVKKAEISVDGGKKWINWPNQSDRMGSPNEIVCTSDCRLNICSRREPFDSKTVIKRLKKNCEENKRLGIDQCYDEAWLKKNGCLHSMYHGILILESTETYAKGHLKNFMMIIRPDTIELKPSKTIKASLEGHKTLFRFLLTDGETVETHLMTFTGRD